MNETLMDRPTSGATADALAAELRDVRAHTRRLTEDLTTEQLMGPMLPVVNPVLWEIGHVGWFHEFWTLRHAHSERPLLDRADALWNSSTVAHDTRWELDLPSRTGVFRYMTDVLERQLDRLTRGVDARARYFYELSIRHEDMHVEALFYTRQTLAYPRAEGLGHSEIPRPGAWPGDADVPGGRWRLGATPQDGFVFDNEKWAHDIDIAPFRIAKAAVTNAQFAAFVEAGGYLHKEFWCAEGWDWRERTGADRPVYWTAERQTPMWRRNSEIEPLAPNAPVTFLNWYEANAWCRWAKRRLPTEAEWEIAAIGEPAAGRASLSERRRRWPWGDVPPSTERAHLDFAYEGAVDVAACGAGDSAFGCRQMIGSVWEWTASDFVPFPGFAADPYEDYSQPWFNTRKVLRGGSGATSARIARPQYRNFFKPDRTDVIAGFRTCAL